MRTLSVVIVTHNRPVCLNACLLSVQRAAKPFSDNVEIIIGINGTDPQTDKLLEEFKNVKICRFPKRETPGKVRNLLLREATKEWVYFLDDDAQVPECQFSDFVFLLEKNPEVVVIGGPNLTPQGSNLFQAVSGHVLASRFATSITASRYIAHGKARSCGEESLILCNLFIKASALGKKPFPEDFICAEENWFLQKLKNEGQSMLYSPDLFVWHERRDNIKAYARQIFKYGFGRGQVFRQAPNLTRWIYLVPSSCIVYSFFVITSHRETWLGFPLLVYLTICFAIAGRGFMRKQMTLKSAMVGVGLFPITHLSYGFGLLLGLVKG